MRKTPLLLVIVLLVAPLAHAQQRGQAARTAAATAGADAVEANAGPADATAADVDAAAMGEVAMDEVARDEADSDAGDTTRSGFGQVMSVLTGLLADAAQREATGRGEGLALDNPAIEISVTPVDGARSFVRDPRPAAKRTRGRPSAAQLAGGTPP